MPRSDEDWADVSVDDATRCFCQPPGHEPTCGKSWASALTSEEKHHSTARHIAWILIIFAGIAIFTMTSVMVWKKSTANPVPTDAKPATITQR